MFPYFAFCCFCFSGSGQEGCVNRRVCGGCAAAVDMEFLSVVWFSLTPCWALVTEDTEDTTGTQHAPAEKKH